MPSASFPAAKLTYDKSGKPTLTIGSAKISGDIIAADGVAFSPIQGVEDFGTLRLELFVSELSTGRNPAEDADASVKNPDEDADA